MREGNGIELSPITLLENKVLTSYAEGNVAALEEVTEEASTQLADLSEGTPEYEEFRYLEGVSRSMTERLKRLTELGGTITTQASIEITPEAIIGENNGN